MSTAASSDHLAVNRIEPYLLANVSEARTVHSYAGTFDAPEATRFKAATPEKGVRPTPLRTKRRMKGFLIEMRPDSARVGFVESGRTILYDMPADQLRRAGIEVQNQPFQMDEIETEDENGALIVGYRFVPLAQPKDAYIQTLSFDEERKRKRQLILRHFSKAKD